MKNIYKNLVNGSFLGAVLLLGATACSDDHFDIKEQPGAEGGMTTIWERIEANPELSEVAELLKVTRVMKDDKDAKATLKYSEWLDQPMAITAWLPKNGTFNEVKDRCYALLDSAATLKSEGKIAESLRTEYRVVNQFVKNHLALFNYGSTSVEQQVRLLNSKHCDFNAPESMFNKVSFDPALTTHNSNGSLFILSGASEFSYNIYDYMSSDEQFSTIYKIISNPAIDKNVFWPEASTQGAINEKGEIVYVDSVYRNTNEILNSANALIKSEDSIYVALIPTDASWKETHDAVKPLFNYGKSYNYDWVENKFTKTGNNALKINVDSLRELNTSAAIIESMFFNPTNCIRKDGTKVNKENTEELLHYIMYEADSLISTNGVVFYNENAGTDQPNPLFAGLEPIKASNGIIFAPTSNRIKPEWSFMRRQEMRPGVILASLVGCLSERGEYLKLTVENWQKNLVVGSVEDDNYYYFVMDGNSTLKIRMKLQNLTSGHYKISAQMLPNRINKYNVRYEDDQVTPKVESPLFDAKLYLDDNLSRAVAQVRNLTVNQDSVQNVVLFEDFNLNKSYKELPAGYETFPILEISMSSSQKRKGNCDALSIAKIIVEPIRK